MKFDIAIMNPPYKSNFHLKILINAIMYCNEIVSINPFSCFDSITERTKLSDTLKQYIAYYEIVEKDYANEIFSISSAANLAIYKLTQNKTNNFKYKFENLISVIDKLRKQQSWRKSFTYEEKQFQFHCQGDSGFYKSAKLDARGLLNGRCNARLVFESQQDKDNFYNSLDCWPYKIMQIVDNGSAVPAHLPFMSDYSQQWTDERFRDYFNITDEEWQLIEETMKKYN